ncbi:uncharacterized protein [Mytilus edulis]|uniref:uncharacterized protein n=1 Tax=Mytilus edulis TaxID=6550 RepID=UPI0039F13680
MGAHSGKLSGQNSIKGHEDIGNKVAIALKAGDSKLCHTVIKEYIKYGWNKNQICKWLIEAIFNHNLNVVKAIITGVDVEPELQSELRKLRYKGYTALRWAEVLESREIVDFLQRKEFVALGSSTNAWSAISSIIIIENEHLIQNVATLINKRHDVNKPHSDFTHSDANQCDTQDRVMLNETPFLVALKTGRYDVMALLLMNGALPLVEDFFLYRLLEINVRAKVFYLLLSCNALKSMPAGDTSLLQFLLARSIHVYVLSHVKPSIKDLIMLLLETFDDFCHEDKRFLLSNDVYTVDEEILAKIHSVLYEPRTLADLCRRRLRSHLGLSFQIFINYIKHGGFPPRIIKLRKEMPSSDV